jgi:hypothetical protein
MGCRASFFSSTGILCDAIKVFKAIQSSSKVGEINSTFIALIPSFIVVMVKPLLKTFAP